MTDISWKQRIQKVLKQDCGNLEITHGELVDGNLEPLFDFIESERRKAVFKFKEKLKEEWDVLYGDEQYPTEKAIDLDTIEEVFTSLYPEK